MGAVKVVIVGGGLAGSALAMALVRVRPQVHLTVLDAPDRPRASTIPAALCHPLTGWSMQHWEGRLNDFRAAIGWLEEVCESSMWLRRSLMRPLPDDHRGQRLLRSFTRVGGDGVQHLAPEAVAERYPEVGAAPLGALVFDGAACVDVAALCQRVRDVLEIEADVVFLRREVAAVSSSGVALEDGEEMAADHVIVCGGADSGRLMPALGTERPYFGELLFMDVAPPDVFVAGGCHVATAPDGRVVVGSTWLSPDEAVHPEAREAARHDLQQRAATLVPGLADAAVVGTWSGHRAKFQHGASTARPFLAASGTAVHALTGFGATGLSRAWPYALAAARAIADQGVA